MLHMRACLIFSIALLAPTANALLSTQCWRVIHSQLTSQDAVPCGVVTADSPTVACCNPDSLCLQGNICQTQGTVEEGFTGYYVAGCTDSNYLDPSCSPYCKSLYRADIVYNNASRLWACCGTESDNNTVNCLEPTNQEFDDPAPGDLSATFSAASTASTGVATSSSISPANTQTTATSSSSTSVATSSALPSQTGTSQPSSRGGLSTRAKVGVGIGVSIGALVVLLGVALLCIRSKRKNQMNQSVTGMPIEHVHESKAWVQELGGQQKPAELNSRPAIHEMYTERS